MAAPNLALAIVYVDAGKLYFASGNGKMLSLDLPPTVFRDLEIISRDALNQLMQGLIQTQKLAPSALVLIFSEATYFEKDLAEAAQPDSPEVTEFAESVPFDRVLARAYPLASGSKVIAMNRDLYDAVRDAFIASGFKVHSVVPAYVLRLLGISKLDETSARQLLKRADELKPYTIVSLHQAALSLQEKEEELAKKHTPLILGFFLVFLVVVGGVTFFVLRQQQQSVRQIAPPTTPLPTLTPAPAVANPAATVSVTIAPYVRQ